LRGYCNDKCIVGLNINDIKEKIDFSKKTILFSQTTMNVRNYNLLFEQIKNEFKKHINLNDDELYEKVKIENTVCKFMINREEKLKRFAKKNDFILFVAGHHSSNGKVLYEICKQENPNTLFIEDIAEIDISALNKNQNIGITGATSTPKWYLESIKNQIEILFNQQ
jgi:4-hydroxy-3-methylbut-2-enyl diphosphate reductase